ncbi:MAG: rRNA maturation RNase YbeY [Candidatus Omnitrophota bacterium]
MIVEILNQQKIKKINLGELRKYLSKIFALLGLSSRISFLLSDNSLIRVLNRKYFQKNYSTDVIAFPLKNELESDYLGEVVVSVEQAVKVSKELGLGWKEELTRYLVHGILHLVGYDDRTKKQRTVMEKKQDEILKEIFRNR